MSDSKTRSRGFTLVEALAALMLVAIVLPVVMRGVTLSAQGVSLADRQETAMMLAQTKLEEAILAQAWQFGDDEGDFSDFYGSDAQRYTWSLVIQDWISTDFRELTMTVYWTQGYQQQSVELKTVIYAGV